MILLVYGRDAPVELTSRLGPVFVGSIIAVALWAVALAQVSTYLSVYSQDVRTIKNWVAGTFLTVTAGVICVLISLYQTLVQHFGEISAVERVNVFNIGQIIFMSITAAQVQSFYAFRIWKLSESICVFIILEIGVLAHMASYIVLAFYLIYGNHDSQTIWAAETSIITVVMDMSLAAAMCFLLLRRSSSFNRTRAIVRRLIVFSLSSGLVTATLAFVICVVYFAQPHSTNYVGVYIPIQFLYANSMLATLNARNYIVQSTNNNLGLSTPLELTSIGTPRTASSVNVFGRSRATAPRVDLSGIAISSTVERTDDGHHDVLVYDGSDPKGGAPLKN